MPPLRDPSARNSRYGGGRVIVLPVETTIKAPKMPPGRKWSAAERRLWRELWRSPQASMWGDEVATMIAVYLIHYSAILAGDAPGWVGLEFRRLGDSLGLSPSGLQARGWQLQTAATTGGSVSPLRPV
jgi:hypothetical protein